MSPQKPENEAGNSVPIADASKDVTVSAAAKAARDIIAAEAAPAAETKAGIAESGQPSVPDAAEVAPAITLPDEELPMPTTTLPPKFAPITTLPSTQNMTAKGTEPPMSAAPN